MTRAVSRSRRPPPRKTEDDTGCLSTNAAWIGPGHCSVVEGPSGDWQMVYHAWEVAQVGSGYTRRGMIDPVRFVDGWPIMREAPSMRSAPLP